MNTLTPQDLSLVGFAAGHWADWQLATTNGNRKRLRQVGRAGMLVHRQADLYAAAPELHQVLASLIEVLHDHDTREVHHARRAVHRAACKTVPCDGYQLQLL
jgi:hypothetical protein